MKELENVKHEMFCREYIIDLNGSQAYIRTYGDKITNDTARANASKLLANTNIKRRINYFKEKRVERLEVTADDIARDIISIKNRCMQAEPVTKYCPIEKKMVEVPGEYQFKENGALKACELLGRHKKMFTDKIEHSGKLDIEKLSDEEIEERIKQLENE